MAVYVRSVIPYINRSELISDTVQAICVDDFETFLKNINNENKKMVITGPQYDK